MGYKANFFNDAGYWIWISVGGVLILALADAMVNILHGWFARTFAIAVVLSLVFYLYDRYRQTRRREALRKLLPVFEAQRRKMEIRLHPGDMNKYCLYWNVTKESKLLKEVNPEFGSGILG